MVRKDCDNYPAPPVRHRAARRNAAGRHPGTLALLLPFVITSTALGGTVRLWSTAVVVEESIRVRDICEFRGFSPGTESALAKLVVADAPAPGGSRIIHMDAVRSALTDGGANMAELALRGSIECAVSRPAKARESKSRRADAKPAARSSDPTSAAAAGPADSPTLRAAIEGFFNDELSRYDGKAELTFDRTSDQVLDLAGPKLSFRIRRRGGSSLGLVPLEVDVVSDGRTLQTVALVVRVEMRRNVVIARRTINQGATVGETDVEVVPLTFTRFERLGMRDPARAVGQRPKRVIPAGAMLEADVLEQVPLVLRGQLVTISSVSGPVRIKTAGKAMQEGLYGDVIRVRSTDDSRAEMDAVVTGPGEVRVGTHRRKPTAPRLARGDRP